MAFKPNRKFKKEYDRLFKMDPLGANTFLLLCELADARGRVYVDPTEFVDLIAARFEDPEEYAL
jgi:hypothetical protein